MMSAYEASRGESGRGMKRRILDHLGPTALRSAGPIYHTIQTDLMEGLADLDVTIVGMFRKLAQAADDQARIVAHNANVDAVDASKDPALAAILTSMPTDWL